MVPIQFQPTRQINFCIAHINYLFIIFLINIGHNYTQTKGVRGKNDVDQRFLSFFYSRTTYTGSTFLRTYHLTIFLLINNV